MTEKGPKPGKRRKQEKTSEKIVFTAEEREFLAMWLETMLKAYDLPAGLKKKVFDNLMKLSEGEISPEDIMDRFRQLMTAYGEYNQISWMDSDKVFVPEPTNEEIVKEAEERGISEGVSKLISRLERKFDQVIPKKDPKPH